MFGAVALGAGFDHFGQRLVFLCGGALYDIRKVGDEVSALLKSGLHIGPLWLWHFLRLWERC